MAKNTYPRSATNIDPNSDLYMAWDTAASKVKAMKLMSEAVDSYQVIDKTTAHSTRDYRNLQTNISGRPGLTRQDYDWFRPHESIPTDHYGILAASDMAYQRIGLIRNIVDLMGDFASQGVRLVHPNKRVEKFYRHWFVRVKGRDRSERFLNNLYRTGNVVIRKQTARLNLANRERIFKGVAKPDTEIDIPMIAAKEIPWRYVFLHPGTVQVVGGSLAAFVGVKRYALRLPANLRRYIKSPTTKEEKDLVAKLPEELRLAAESNQVVLLPEDKISVFHYKKDDWQEWANPMIYAILDDAVLLEKLKLADMAALDGAISNIRIFKLGSLEHKIAPSPAAASKLAAVLESNVGAGTMDLVWGPDIELVESKTAVHQFLGEEKYKPTLNNIYAGLGIPPTLTGTFGAAGTTNNFISLKTLTQRLEYGRDILLQFWNAEIAHIQKAMGFRFPAQVEFDVPNLADEDAEKALLIQMADRNLISDELLQTKFKHDPVMERIRLNREAKDRDNDRMVQKSSPYHDPQFELALKKIALQTGAVTPSEVGLDLEPRKSGEQPALKMKIPPGGPSGPKKKPGQPQKGRPKTSKDTQKRKTKTFKPRANAAIVEVWATKAQRAISGVVNDGVLALYKKSSMRHLTADETKIAEQLKFSALWHLTPLSIVDHQMIGVAVGCGDIPPGAKEAYQSMSNTIRDELNRPLTMDELRRIQVQVYTLFK